MKLIVKEVEIIEDGGKTTPAFYIHNEDYTYRHWVFIDGRCATAVKGVANPVSYIHTHNMNELIIEQK